MGNSTEVPSKTENRDMIYENMKIEIENIRFSNPTLGHRSRRDETSSKRYVHPVFIAALFTRSEIWKELKCPSTDEWIKMCCALCVYVCVCVYTQP